MINILITSCSRDVTLVKAFRAAVLKHGGGKVIGADIDAKSAALYFADEYRIIPHSDSDEFIPYLVKLCRVEKINLVISSRDAELPVLSIAKSPLEANGTRVMAADYLTLKICQDKLLFCKFCEEHGFPIPKTYYHYSPGEEMTFPLFIKPIVGAGSMKIHRVNTPREFELLKEIYPDGFLVQEYVDWPEYTVDLFADFGGRVISVIPRERLRTVGGESYIGRTVKSDVIVDSSIRLAQKLGLIGHNTLQCFSRRGSATPTGEGPSDHLPALLSERRGFPGLPGNRGKDCSSNRRFQAGSEREEVKFIEVNPRFGGGANLGFHSGVNTPELLVRMLLGETIEPMISQFKENLVMLRYTQDIFLEQKQEAGAADKFELVHNRCAEPNQIYCIDVDGTVCIENVEYEKALPIEKTVKKINELYDRGHTIILYTARGAYSGKDWSELTEKQLKSWGVKYHRFMIGKPFAHWYVDNKAIHILDWF